jgi:hypothetical protein
LIDVVSMQLDGVIEKLTVEAGVLHATAYTMCWGKTFQSSSTRPSARCGHELVT